MLQMRIRSKTRNPTEGELTRPVLQSHFRFAVDENGSGTRLQCGGKRGLTPPQPQNLCYPLHPALSGIHQLVPSSCRKPVATEGRDREDAGLAPPQPAPHTPPPRPQQLFAYNTARRSCSQRMRMVNRTSEPRLQRETITYTWPRARALSHVPLSTLQSGAESTGQALWIAVPGENTAHWVQDKMQPFESEVCFHHFWDTARYVLRALENSLM